MIERRTFLKVASVAVGTMAIQKYVEPFEVVPENDWVTDRGDYYIVRVPDFKTFSNEFLNKPTIFILGEKAVVSMCDIIGFVNIAAPKGGLFSDSWIDASKIEVPRKRPIAEIKANGIMVSGLHCIGVLSTDSEYDLI